MRNPYPINHFLIAVIRAWMFFFKRYHKIRVIVPPEVKKLSAPYLLISNHVGRYDPFIIGTILKKTPNFVSSDAVLRDRVIGTVFKLLGAMPKRKGTRDTYIIREMRKVIDAGGSIGLFPEGARTWSGTSLDIDPSVVKLMRLLQVPVITAKMKGAYWYDPRWAVRVRRSGFDIEYTLLYTPEQIKKLSDEELYQGVLTHVQHDDIAWQEQHKRIIHSDKRAENIELILFACPICNSFEGFTSTKNSFSCKQCATHVDVDEFGFFSSNNQNLPYTNTRDWMKWQNVAFVQHVFEHMQKGALKAPFFTSVPVTISYASGTDRLAEIGTGTIAFFVDRLEIYSNAKTTVLPWREVDMISPQYKDRLELTNIHNEAYRFTSNGPFESGIKWELTLNAVRYYQGNRTQLSPHFKSLLEEAGRILG